MTRPVAGDAGRQGRAARFFVLGLGGWIALRAAMAFQPTLMPAKPEAAVDLRGSMRPADLPDPAHRPIPTVVSTIASITSGPIANTRLAPWSKPASPMPAPRAERKAVAAITPWNDLPRGSPRNVLIGQRPPPSSAPSVTTASAVERVSTSAATVPGSAWRDRWRGSAWTFWRPDEASGQPAIGAGAGPLPGTLAGTLGGSQAGFRIAWHPGGSDAFAVYARGTVSPGPRGFGGTTAVDGGAGPMRVRGAALREGAIGIALRPVASVPMTVLLERRSASGSGRAVRDGRASPAANMLAVVGGVSDYPLTAAGRAVLIDGYGQAGVVQRRRSAIGFAEGTVGITTPVAQTRDGPTVAAGVVVAGSVQGTGATGDGEVGTLARLDVGPRLTVRLPPGAGSVRLTADWRQRIAGNAAPGSGPALGVALDF